MRSRKVTPRNRLPALIYSFIALSMSCVTSHRAASELEAGVDSPGTCLAAYEKAQKSKGGFVGYGSGLTDQLAIQVATDDMVRQIQTKVAASTSVHETNTNVSFESLGTSSIDELLVGLSIDKRCPVDGHWDAVVSISKPLFLRNLRTRITQDLAEADRLLDQLTASSDIAMRLNGAVEARKFLGARKSSVQDTLALCTTLGGCIDVSSTVLGKLESMSSTVLAQNSFFVVADGEEAAKVIGPISSLIADEGFQVATSASAPGSVKVTCFRRDYPKMDGTTYLITEISCTALFQTGGQTAFSRKYLGKGLGSVRDEALNAARRQLVISVD